METPGFLLTNKNAKIWKNNVPHYLIYSLLDSAKQLRDENKFTLSSGYSKTGQVVKLTREQRGTHQCNASLETLKLNEWIYPKLVEYANTAFFVGNRKLLKTQDYYLWYDPGFGITLHADDSTNGSRDYHRVLTVLVYLNDDYEGGEICFPQHNFILKPKVGDVLAFPGNRLFQHEVKPIISGHRFAIMQT
jgi:predicted 2-oxoglutarate/Fe(II)-dependent dioxygenase YbiX